MNVIEGQFEMIQIESILGKSVKINRIVKVSRTKKLKMPQNGKTCGDSENKTMHQACICSALYNVPIGRWVLGKK